MLKDDRYRVILDSLDENHIIQVSNLANSLSVTETTIRRDLKHLEEQGLLVRIRGGAKKKAATYTELTHREKQTINIDKKKQIAKKCASLINENDIVFIGSGTTSDLIFDYIGDMNITVITNSISVFNRIKDQRNYDVLLTGGRYRDRTGTFVGYFADQFLKEFRVNKAIVGTNGIDGHNITNANEEEGNGLRIILDNAKERFILADSTKFDTEAFFTFYNVQDVTAIITDSNIRSELFNYYNQVTNVLKL